MKIIADLQVHSRFSRATSTNLNIPNLEKYARIKGLNLLGTGDISHPEWLQELKRELTEDGSGILTSKTGFKFVLQGEISNIYTHNKKGRKVHTLLLAPNFEIAEQMQAALKKKGRIDYDGRPIFGFSCPELVEMMKSISDGIEIIPAHIWTPWFSLFGSMSGFDSVKDCFQDQEKHIYALETGLSSDPAMNWRLSQLDKYTLLSNSDAHSFWPWRLGREANVLDIDLTYKELINSIRTRKGLLYTIEVDPNYGKYHVDGHRACNVSMSPQEARKHNSICPVCKQQLTIGVLHRVEDLADREEGFVPKNAIPFKSVMPLSEIIAGVIQSPVASKKVWELYMVMIKDFGSEFEVLLEAPQAELLKKMDKGLADAIISVREGTAKIEPGYDGVYGKAIFDKNNTMTKNIDNTALRSKNDSLSPTMKKESSKDKSSKSSKIKNTNENNPKKQRSLSDF